MVAKVRIALLFIFCKVSIGLAKPGDKTLIEAFVHPQSNSVIMTIGIEEINELGDSFQKRGLYWGQEVNGKGVFHNFYDPLRGTFYHGETISESWSFTFAAPDKGNSSRFANVDVRKAADNSIMVNISCEAGTVCFKSLEEDTRLSAFDRALKSGNFRLVELPKVRELDEILHLLDRKIYVVVDSEGSGPNIGKRVFVGPPKKLMPAKIENGGGFSRIVFENGDQLFLDSRSYLKADGSTGDIERFDVGSFVRTRQFGNQSDFLDFLGIDRMQYEYVQYSTPCDLILKATRQ